MNTPQKIEGRATRSTSDMIVLEQVKYRYPDTRTNIIDSVNLVLKRGRVVAIVGPSGCGKSTLLKIVGGLIEPSHGQLRIDHPVTIGYSPQHPNLLPWLTLQDNLSFMAQLRHQYLSSKEQQQLFNFMGLENYKKLQPGQLSGGMQTRLSLARALAGAPDLLLLDEPFSSLDEVTAERLIVDLNEFLQDKRPTTLFVSHNIAQAVLLADTVVVMSAVPMKIVGQVDVNLPHRHRVVQQTDAFVKAVRQVRNLLNKGVKR